MKLEKTRSLRKINKKSLAVLREPSMGPVFGKKGGAIGGGKAKVIPENKINLNFTIRNIRSGLPLRIWDILGAGGFLITNYQPEIEMYFKNGEDLVFFTEKDDLREKVSYYLTHEEERKRIAMNGQRKVRKLHGYQQRFDEMKKIIQDI